MDARYGLLWIWSTVWCKRMSSARHQFLLVLQLNIRWMQHKVFVKFCYISGDWMIITGIDGWSRGHFDSGVSLGHDLYDYLPLSLSQFDTAMHFLWPWLRGWMGAQYLEPLSPEGWLSTGHTPRIHIWAPPPAAGLYALKQWVQAKLKHLYTTMHVILIPCFLDWEEWRSRFDKQTNIWFVMTAGSCWL